MWGIDINWLGGIAKEKILKNIVGKGRITEEYSQVLQVITWVDNINMDVQVLVTCLIQFMKLFKLVCPKK